MALNAKQEKQLWESALFSGCNAQALRTIVQTLTPINVMKGQLLELSVYGMVFGMVLEGSLDFCGPNGTLFTTLESGRFIATESLFSEEAPLIPNQLRARTNCTVALIKKEQLMLAFEKHPQLRQNYIRILSDCVQLSLCRLQHFTAQTPSVALALFLLYHEKQNILRMSDGFAGLARRLNISRATLYRSISDLEEAGLVSRQEKTIRILDRERLRSFVQANSLPQEQK